MTMPELHPDELLWREARDQLTTAERADLVAHLTRCPACTLERAVRTDALRARVPSDADHEIAARILQRVLTGQRSPSIAGVAPPPRGPRLARAAVLLLLLTSAGVGTAAVVVRMREHRATREETTAGTHDVEAAATAGQRQRRLRQPALSTDPGAPPPVPPPNAVSDNQAAAAPEAPKAVPAAMPGLLLAPSPARDGRVRPSSHQGPPPPDLPPSALVAPPPAAGQGVTVDANLVFGRAEQARVDRRFVEADQLYGELARRFAGSREDVVARVLHGQLLLDHRGDPGGALALFDRYLAVEPLGTLAEEARLGRAQALGRLGRGAEERAAWLDLLRKHPSSVHAAAARARLVPPAGP